MEFSLKAGYRSLRKVRAMTRSSAIIETMTFRP